MPIYEGYIKGNLFPDLYDQYLNYQPAKLIPNNEQAELLLNVNQTTFAAHELKLYLDIYPNDTNMIQLYNEYQLKAPFLYYLALYIFDLNNEVLLLVLRQSHHIE